MKLSETSSSARGCQHDLGSLVLFGASGYTRLSVRELADIDPPIIWSQPPARGQRASRGTAVTDVLEEELSTIQGLRTLSSSSSERTADHPRVQPRRPADVAAQDVRDKVSRVRGRLPVDVLEPVIAKAVGRCAAVLLAG